MPQFKQRSVLIVAAIFLAILLVSVIGKRGSSGGISNKDKGLRTQEAVALIDRAEVRYLAAHKSYTSHLADLLALNPRLAQDIEVDLDVVLDVSGDGQTYVAQVSGSIASFVRVRSPKGIVADTCFIVKKGTGFKCPVPPAPKTGTTSTTTTPK